MIRARNDDGTLRSWPLYVLAAPATVAVWSGWVGLGEMTGFGKVHPLPGIWDTAAINTAITLPIGVEAYAAYALGAWLSRKTLSTTTRSFAKFSAIGALVLGALGQISYHLLINTAAASAAKTGHAAAAKVGEQTVHAPTWITILVACFPVLVLGMGATLAHLIHRDGEVQPVEPNEVHRPLTICRGSIPLPVPQVHPVDLGPVLDVVQRMVQDLTPEPVQVEPAQVQVEPARQVQAKVQPESKPQVQDTSTLDVQTEVQQVVDLIEERGYDEVTLTVVQRELDLKKSTAYNRLTAARRLVNQEQAS